MRPRLAFLTVVLLSFCPSLLQSATIRVPDDQPNIQAGIDVSNDGDTVLVSPGTYHENITFDGRSITICSLFLTTGDPAYISSTVIDGDGSDSVVRIPNLRAEVPAVLCGFTIEDGWAEKGGGIYCVTSSVIISSNIVKNNMAFATPQGQGGGLYCTYSSPMIRDNVFLDNNASGPLGGSGGGVFLLNSDAELSRNRMIGNLGDFWGGGIYCDESDPIMHDNVIVQNYATVSGGGIFCDMSNPVMNKNTFSGNEAVWTEGGGMYCENSSPIVTNTIFWGDSSFEGNSEIVVESGSPVITYSDVETGWPGEGNRIDDPLFADAEDLDYTLLPGSPCIDEGSPDMPGEPWGGWRLDIGAFEYDQGFYFDGHNIIRKPVPVEPPLVEKPSRMIPSR